MKKLNFITNSRHISQLGRELMTDFVTALVELIKNAYDADAYAVRIIFERVNSTDSRILVVDTGCGMTQDDFERKWMVIGTNNKVTTPYTPNGRKKVGKKGIGRFSVERLAEQVTVYSFPYNEKPFKVKINWNHFESINIADIKQRLQVLYNHFDISAAKYVASQLDFILSSHIVSNKDKDDVRRVLGINTIHGALYSLFSKQDILKSMENVIPILEKYEVAEQLVEDIDCSLFEINSSEDGEIVDELDALYTHHNLSSPRTGIVLELKNLRDEWKQKDINKLTKELRLLVAPDLLEYQPFQIELRAPEFQVDELALVNEILSLRFAKIEAKIYDDACKHKVVYTDRNGETRTINDTYDTPKSCGNVTVEINFFLRDSNNLTGANGGYNYRYAIRVLDAYSGIKIYRDNFRVKPYGDTGNDWLQLDQQKVKDTHGYLVGNNQVIGIVKINDINNPLLVDATNREGIIENEAYSQLQDFVQQCTNFISMIRREAFAQQRTNEIVEQDTREREFQEQFTKVKEIQKNDTFVHQLTNLKNEAHLPSEKLDTLTQQYMDGLNKREQSLTQLQTQYEQHYEETKRSYERKINFQESELQLFKNLASLGMLTGSFGHETSDIVNRIKASLFLLRQHIITLPNYGQPLNIFNIVERDFNRIYAYSSLIESFLRKRKRMGTALLNFAEVLNEVCTLYKNIVDPFGVCLIWNCQNDIKYVMRQIDLESIIINMITNAFEQVKGCKLREVSIIIEKVADVVYIIFEDSGPGVTQGMEKIIFQPFTTTKENGIGLGLSIVKDIVESYHGTIIVSRSEKFSGARFDIILTEDGDWQ